MNFFEAFIIAIVEGLTEFLPISSTGHMILARAFLGLKADDQFIKLFIICIQLGAILSVVVVYFKRFFKTYDFYYKLIAAFIPSAIAGILLKKYLDSAMENILGIAIFLLLGGIILIFVDRWFLENKLDQTEDISYKNAFCIGLFQCLALFPGVSRSAATIIGGMAQKLTRKNAAEFSFFLAVPTMFGATAKKLYDYQEEATMGGVPALEFHHISMLIFGNIIAFLVAILAIKFFINMLNKHGFQIYGWYRIVLGSTLLLLYFMGIIKQV